MSLAAEIESLRDRALTEFTAIHDYYADTKIAWRFAHKLIRSGRTFTVRNRVTNTSTTGVQLAQKARGYVSGHLAEATFQQFIAVFENFFFDFLRIWLIAYPQSLGKKELLFQTVLDSADKESITLVVVNSELNEVAYDRVTSWFKYLERRVNLECPTEDEIARIAEAKASRDVLAHNRGIANATYISKACGRSRFDNGQKIEIPEHYHREIFELFRKVVSDISSAAAAKAG